MRIQPWIEAMRLRTLPVSIAGVLAGWAVAIAYDRFKWAPALICLVFALLAQIVSNFANEYFDFKKGLDRKGRQGFRRGVTEGDISPIAMKRAITAVSCMAAIVGLSLVYWGGLWLIPVGAVIAIAAFAYSAGPWPLSHHALGDETVIIFYGIVPVMMTAYIMCGEWLGSDMAAYYGDMWVIALLTGLGVGFLGVDVLTVNNIRDARDDAKVGKRTKAVVFGINFMRMCYIFCGYIGMSLIWYAFRDMLPSWGWAGYVAIGIWALPLIVALFKFNDYRLNKVLRYTAVLLLSIVVWTIISITSLFGIVD